MANYYRDYWTCPFFGTSTRCGCRCEGGSLELPTSTAARAYHAEFCANVNGWRRCTVARALLRHYEA